MESSLIEKLDKSRYNLIKWLTIGWAIWFGGFILKELISSQIIFGLVILIGLIGWILFSVNLFNFLRVGKKVNADNRLKEALNNEMYELYKYKSFYWGFWTTIASTAIFIGISAFYILPALFVCEVTLFLGVLSTLIAGLIYNKG